MYTLSGKNMTFTIDAQGRCASFVNKLTGHEYVKEAGEMWKMIYARGQMAERPIYSEGQQFVVTKDGNSLSLHYQGLVTEEGKLDITLDLLLMFPLFCIRSLLLQ